MIERIKMSLIFGGGTYILIGLLWLLVSLVVDKKRNYKINNKFDFLIKQLLAILFWPLDIYWTLEKSIDELKALSKYWKPSVLSLKDAALLKALDASIYYRYDDRVKKLLKKGADPNARDINNSEFALHKAIRNGHREACKLLIEAGANPNAQRPRQGGTVLHSAAKYDDPELMGLLIEAGGNISEVDVNNDTVLMKAIGGGCKEVVKFLLKAGADPSCNYDKKEIAITKALRGGYIDIGYLLLKSHGIETTRNSVLVTLILPALGFIRTNIEWLFDRVEEFTMFSNERSDEQALQIESETFDGLREAEFRFNRVLKEAKLLLIDLPSLQKIPQIRIQDRLWMSSSHLDNRGVWHPDVNYRLALGLAWRNLERATSNLLSIFKSIDELCDVLKATK